MILPSLTSFHLKIIALSSMFLDHAGYLLLEATGLAAEIPALRTLDLWLRFIGRLALPLFIFMLSEGMHFTHDRRKYLLRLGGFAVLMYVLNSSLDLILVSAGKSTAFFSLNAFVDLFLYASFIYFLEHPNRKLHKLAILPIMYFLLNTFLNLVVEPALGEYSFFIHNLSADYRYYGFLLFLAFYYARKTSGRAITTKNQLAEPTGKEVDETSAELASMASSRPQLLAGLANKSPTKLTTKKPASATMRVVVWQILAGSTVIILFTLFNIVIESHLIPLYDAKGYSYTSSALLAARDTYHVISTNMYNLAPYPWFLNGGVFGLLIMPLVYFYNGKRGYNAKWFNRFEYLFYPLHALLLGAVGLIIVNAM